MDNIVIGRYLPLDSFIHKLDPRIKIISMMLVLVGIFLPAGFLGYLILAILIFVAYLLSKIPLSFIWKSFKPLLFMMTFLLVFNLFFIRTGNVILDLNIVQIYDGALKQTLYIIIRLVLMIATTTVVITSTKPLDLTHAIEDLLSPLKVVKLPAHEIAMIISIALRFIPTLIEETSRIMKAQASRGVDFDGGKLKEKIKAILSLIIPLFVASFKRADELANAMEARGYVVNGTRTRYRQFHIRMHDWLVLAVCVLVLIILVIIIL